MGNASSDGRLLRVVVGDVSPMGVVAGRHELREREMSEGGEGGGEGRFGEVIIIGFF